MRRRLAIALVVTAVLVGSAPAAGAKSVDRRSTERFVDASIGVLQAAIAGRGRRSVVRWRRPFAVG